MRNIWVKLVLATSLDGRIAFPQGGNSKLGSTGDRRVLEESLAWCDATLMGGKTLRIHRNTCLIHNRDLIEKRQLEGRSKQPISIIVSSQNDSCRNWQFFKQPIERWLLSPNKLNNTDSLNKYEHQLTMKKNWVETLTLLTDKGLSKIVLLGGSQLASSLLQADRVDELQLTFIPKILGGTYTWVSTQINNVHLQFSSSDSWELKESITLGNNEIMLRYYRHRPLKQKDS